MKKTFTSLVILALSLLLIIGVMKMMKKNQNSGASLAQKVEFFELVDNFSSEIAKRYKLGDYDDWIQKSQKCGHLITDNNQVSEIYLECNMNYVDCWIRENSEKYLLNIQSQKSFIEDKEYSIRPYSQAYSGEKKTSFPFGFIIEFEKYGEKLSLAIKEECKRNKLEERIYLYQENKKEMLWDNFGRNIYFDKYPVSIGEVNWWILFDHEAPKEKFISEPDKWYQPSINLTFKEKQNYCAYVGARLIESHIYDAATVLPTKMDKPQNNIIKNYPYPWTKNINSVFQMLSKNTDNIFNFINEENCKKIYSKECKEKKFPFKYYSGNSISWNGLSMILGGYQEIMMNRKNEDLIIKRSSWDYSLSSDFHQLMKRDKLKESESEKFSFRCMVER